MSTKGLSKDGNDVHSRIRQEDLRISMENLRITNGCDTRGNLLESVGGQFNQMATEPKNVEEHWNEVQLIGAVRNVEVSKNVTVRSRKLTDKGQEYRKSILLKKKSSLKINFIKEQVKFVIKNKEKDGGDRNPAEFSPEYNNNKGRTCTDDRFIQNADRYKL